MLQKNFSLLVVSGAELIVILSILSALLTGCTAPDKKDIKAIQPSQVPHKAPLAQKQASSFDYYVNYDDVLEVFVWQNPDLSRDVIVRPDGKISLPLAGDLEAVGQTLTQMDKQITKNLSEYILSPQVSLAVKKFGEEKVFVLGEVKKPGVHKYSRQASVMEIISLADGFTKDAKLGEVLIVRGEIEKPEVIRVNVKKILAGDLTGNLAVQPRDIIYVSSSTIGEVGQYIRDYISPVVFSIVNLEYLRRGTPRQYRETR